jgi:hypothetical protein
MIIDTIFSYQLHQIYKLQWSIKPKRIIATT